MIRAFLRFLIGQPLGVAFQKRASHVTPGEDYGHEWVLIKRGRRVHWHRFTERQMNESQNFAATNSRDQPFKL